VAAWIPDMFRYFISMKNNKTQQPLKLDKNKNIFGILQILEKNLMLVWCYDIQHNDAQHNDTQHTNTQH
jgi:hypothetical protein